MPVAACLAVVAAGLALLLLGERRGRPVAAAVGKLLASLAFLAFGWSRLRAGSTADAYLVLGLGLCLVGDLLLLPRRLFAAGLTAFLLGHVAYLAAFHALLPARDWPISVAAPVVSASALAAGWLWPHLGRMRPAVLAYIATITAMVWGALSSALAGALPAAAAGGSVLFYLSDLAVARRRFIAPSLPVRVVGLVAYYLGQVLLAGAVGATGQ
jgi:uncharacterized membrane protein YhhN